MYYHKSVVKDASCMFNATKWTRIRWKCFLCTAVIVNVIICSLQHYTFCGIRKLPCISNRKSIVHASLVELCITHLKCKWHNFQTKNYWTMFATNVCASPFIGCCIQIFFHFFLFRSIAFQKEWILLQHFFSFVPIATFACRLVERHVLHIISRFDTFSEKKSSFFRIIIAKILKQMLSSFVKRTCIDNNILLTSITKNWKENHQLLLLACIIERHLQGQHAAFSEN